MDEYKPDDTLAIKNELGVINNIYFDMSCFQDFNIGGVMKIITTMSEYRYMLSKMDNYNNGCDYSVEKHFPVLKITDDVLEKFMMDEKNHESISNISPMTTLFNDIPIFLNTMMTKNKKFDKNEPLNITVNTYPIKYSIKAKDNFKEYLKVCGVKNEPIFMCEKLNTLSRDFFIPMEYLMICDIEEFLDENSNSARLFCEEGLFVPKTIVAQAKINYKLIEENNYTEPLEQMLINTQNVLNNCTTFKFCAREVLIENIPKED